MAETSIPSLSQSSSFVLHNGKAALPIKAGQTNVFKAKSGEHYRVLKGKEGEEQFVDNVVVKHAGADLKLEYTDGTQVTLENYYVECKAGDCDVTVPGKTVEGYKISSGSTGGAALGDGSSLVYAHGSPEALMGMAQGNAPMQAALGSLKGADITYLPSGLEIGSTNLALLGGGGLVLAAAGGGGGGGGGSALAAAVHNLVGGGVVAGPVVAGNGLTVNLFQADGVTLLGTQKLSDTGTFSIDVGSYTGAVIGKLVDAGAGNDFIDEATGQARDMNANLMAIGVAGSGTTTVNMNALTTIAALKAGAIFAGASAGLITSAVIAQTNAAVASAFGLTDLIGSSVVTTVDTTGSANAAFTPAALTAAAKYGAALAALSGVDAANGGDMQATIDALVAGITVAGSTATLSNATVDAVVLGATTASANTGGTGATSLTAIISTLTAQTSASVSINQIATDGVISAIEQSSTISGTTVAGATVNLTLGANVRAATVVGTTWSYNLTGADIAAMGQGGEVMSATATLAGGGTATATRSAVVDTVGPSVTSVAITSATGIQNSTVNAGDVVSVTVTMSEGTTVTGTPQLSLNIGGTSVLANYASGSGTPYIVFTYTVLASQTDLNGISIGANSLALNGGTLVDAAGNAATVTHAAIADNAGYLVDNTAPTLATTTYSAAENATAVATLAGTDAGAITYSLGGTGADNALFSISSGGALTFLAAKNFEAAGSAAGTNAYAITVNLTDAAGNVTNQAVTVNVTNVNEAPVMNSATTASFAENGTGTVYTAAATDVDAGTTLSYTIGGTDSALFNINASTGAVTFKAVPNYEAPTDAGANNVYDITVTASDGSLTATQAVAITVTNVYEAPTITSAAAVTFSENGTGAAYSTAATVDSTKTLTYSLSGADSLLFNINASTGAVTFNAVPDFEAPSDSGANNVYDITVTASDGSLTATQAVAITVTNVDELDFNLTFVSGTSAQAEACFRTACAYWSSVLTDNVTINLTVGQGTKDANNNTFGSTILASTVSAYQTNTYTQFRAALSTDAKSSSDNVAVASLASLSSFGLLINDTLNNPYGASSSVSYVDNNGNANNTSVQLKTANAKALGLMASNASATDGAIIFNSAFNFDYDQADGINSSYYDFIGIAIHEIGHALGFSSGVDRLDVGPGSNDSAYPYVSPLDLFRFSTLSAANGIIDFSAGNEDKYFSLDNGVTKIASFSTGQELGDKQQASHWKDSLGLGIMDPTVSKGTLSIVTNLDALALDVIGWNLASGVSNAATPTIQSLATVNYSENGVGTAYTVIAADADAATTFTFALGGTDAAKFSINSGTGVVKFLASPNYETPTDVGGNNVYDITVTASDGVHTSTAKAVAITVTNVGEAGDTSIDLGTYGKLIAPVQVDGGQWFYYWDRSGDGSSAASGTLNGGVDYTTHDVLDAIFNQDINGVIGGGGNTTDTYRYATINGVHLALPKFGSQAVLPTTQNYISSQGTSIGAGSNATNNTYDDLLAVWDAYNGTGTQTNISGTPTGWQSAYYWSSTTSNLGHALVGLSTGYVWNYPDTNNYYVALQVL